MTTIELILDDEFQSEPEIIHHNKKRKPVKESKIELNHEPDCCLPLGELQPSSDKTIFYKLPLSNDNQPEPYPEQATDYLSTIETENREYVKMPFEIINEPFGDDNNNADTDADADPNVDDDADHQSPERQFASSWSVIVEKLTSANITNVVELISTIKSYNKRFAKRNFNILKKVFSDKGNERRHFFIKTLPEMINLTIQLPELITQPIPILKQKTNHSLFFSQQQLAAIMAAGFFCTFPGRRRVPSAKILDINFIKLFSDQNSYAYQSKSSKLICLLNYFRRVTKKPPKGIVSFERRWLLADEIPKWSKSNVKLSKMIVKSKKTIEEKGKGMLQINSIHKLIAADYLNYHSSLDAHRFKCSPELLIIGLFTEALLNNESLIVSGVEQFNNPPAHRELYDVSRHNHKDKRPFDDWRRRCTKVVSIDAKHFIQGKGLRQYRMININRDLNKVYSGINDRLNWPAVNRCAVCTGKWGCGVNHGDPRLKSMIFLIAASVAQRDVLFCTYKDKALARELKELLEKLYSKEINASQLYQYLEQFADYIVNLDEDHLSFHRLFPFLTEKIG